MFLSTLRQNQIIHGNMFSELLLNGVVLAALIGAMTICCPGCYVFVNCQIGKQLPLLCPSPGFGYLVFMKFCAFGSDQLLGKYQKTMC